MVDGEAIRGWSACTNVVSLKFDLEASQVVFETVCDLVVFDSRFLRRTAARLVGV